MPAAKMNNLVSLIAPGGIPAQMLWVNASAHAAIVCCFMPER